MSQFQVVQHPADRRTLLWSLFFFPLVPVWGLYSPKLAPGLFVLALYLAFCAGVLAHYHNHRMVFRSPSLSRLYSVWLSVFYGFPIFSWIPTHNQNHHQFVDGPGDLTSTQRRGVPDSLYEALTYPTRSSAWQAPTLINYIKKLRRKNPRGFRAAMAQGSAIVAVHLSFLTLAIACYGAGEGLSLYFVLVLVPALFAPWSMMFINYVQHVGCCVGSASNHSRNFVGAFENWFVFDAGLHTVHHENPGVHWSMYRNLHQARAAQIHPILNQRNVLSFVVRHYFMGGRKNNALPMQSTINSASTI